MNRALPLLVFGTVATLGGLLAFTLPETKGASLKQTVEEGEVFMRDHMCMSSPW